MYRHAIVKGDQIPTIEQLSKATKFCRQRILRPRGVEAMSQWSDSRSRLSDQ